MFDLWFKQNLFFHRNYKFNKSVQETQKQYAYLSVTSRQNDNGRLPTFQRNVSPVCTAVISTTPQNPIIQSIVRLRLQNETTQRTASMFIRTYLWRSVYLVFTHTLSPTYRRRLGSLLLCPGDVCRVLIECLVC